MEALLRRIYYDPATGFGSIAETLKAAKREDPSITREQVRDFLAKQEVRQVRKPRQRSSFVAQGPRLEFQLDLADFSAFDPPSARRYGLVAVDVFSKALSVVPLRAKTAEGTAQALDLVVARLGIPEVVMTDSGTEFQGAFARRCTYYDAEHVTVRFYAAFVERAIKTIKEQILVRQRSFARPWDAFIEAIVEKYNATERARTGMAPEQAAKDENVERVHERLEKHARFFKQPELVEGDLVKILQKPRGPRDLKVNFSAWGKVAHRVERVAPGPDGVVFYTVNGRRYLRAELLKVEDVQRPPRPPAPAPRPPPPGPEAPPAALVHPPLRRLRRIAA